MPHLTYSIRAQAGLERCRLYLAERSESAAVRASAAISAHLDKLESFPGLGRPVDTTEHIRELVIPFGNAGYLALYQHRPGSDEVLILAFRHQREAGY